MFRIVTCLSYIDVVGNGALVANWIVDRFRRTSSYLSQSQLYSKSAYATIWIKYTQPNQNDQYSFIHNPVAFKVWLRRWHS